MFQDQIDPARDASVDGAAAKKSEKFKGKLKKTTATAGDTRQIIGTRKEE
jgi:hypothetical protein